MSGEVGGVPEGWQEVKLSSLTSKITKGTSPSNVGADFSDSGINYVKSDAIHVNNRIDPAKLAKINPDTHRILSRSEIISNDILITIVGNVGQCAIVDEEIAPANTNQNISIIRCRNDDLLPRFLLYNLISSRMQDHIKNLIIKGAQPSINLEHVRAFPILQPPLPEQRKIAAILSTWDDSLATLTSLLAAKRQQKRGLAEALLTGKKRLPGFAGEWKRVRVGDVFRVQKGTQKNRMSLADVGTYPVINGGITPSGFTEEFNTEGNTVTVSEGGNSCGFISLQKDRFWCGGHCYTIQSDAIPVDFQYQILKGQESQIMGLRVGSGLPNIQKKALEAFELNLPTDSAEQQAIASILSTLDAEIASLEALKAKVQEQKRGLMDELLTGRVRVQVEE